MSPWFLTSYQIAFVSKNQLKLHLPLEALLAPLAHGQQTSLFNLAISLDHTSGHILSVTFWHTDVPFLQLARVSKDKDHTMYF